MKGLFYCKVVQPQVKVPLVVKVKIWSRKVQINEFMLHLLEHLHCYWLALSFWTKISNCFLLFPSRIQIFICRIYVAIVRFPPFSSSRSLCLFDRDNSHEKLMRFRLGRGQVGGGDGVPHPTCSQSFLDLSGAWVRRSPGSVCSAWRVINYFPCHFRGDSAEWRSGGARSVFVPSTCGKNRCRGHPERTQTQTRHLPVITCGSRGDQLDSQKDCVWAKMQLRFWLSNSESSRLITGYLT